MGVFVDPAVIPWRGKLWCHIWTDGPADELHAFAASLGLSRSWFQRPPKARWEHYDITAAKRVSAVRAGAVQTDRFGPLEHLARLSGDTDALGRIASLRSSRPNVTEAQGSFAFDVVRSVRADASA